MDKAAPKSATRSALDRIMPRHAPFYFGLALGAVVFTLSLWLMPKYAVSSGANALFIGFLALSFIRLPHLTADYLRKHAREEDTPALGIILIVVIVVAASLVSLFLAMSDSQPDAGEIVASVASVLLGWFTVQALGALHYAYEYYQAPDDGGGNDSGVEGGLQFPGDDEPDGSAFMYFSYTIGTSVATSDTKVASNTMRRRVIFHIVFSHLYNTIILAAAVSVLTGIGG